MVQFTKTKPHIIRQDVEGEDSDWNKRPIAWVHPASMDAVSRVLAAMEGDEDGRSEYCWLRLPNGDLMLGVFPRGDIYFDVEIDASYPG